LFQFITSKSVIIIFQFNQLQGNVQEEKETEKYRQRIFERDLLLSRFFPSLFHVIFHFHDNADEVRVEIRL
jgi:hypothetical protein